MTIEAALHVMDRGPARPHHPRRAAHTCVACRQRRSRFRFRGAVRADRHHPLCFQCYRALRDRVRLHDGEGTSECLAATGSGTNHGAQPRASQGISALGLWSLLGYNDFVYTPAGLAAG